VLVHSTLFAWKLISSSVIIFISTCFVNQQRLMNRVTNWPHILVSRSVICTDSIRNAIKRWKFWNFQCSFTKNDDEPM